MEIKHYIFVALATILVSCQEESLLTDSGKKNISVQLKGVVDIKSSSLGKTNGANPTYYFIELLKGNELYASGAFSDITSLLNLSVANNVNYTLNVKAVKKGWSYGIRRVVENGRTTINWSEITDVMVYSNPIQNGANAGLSWIYTKADSSETMYQYYPQTDTYFAQYTFNSGTQKDTVELELKRQIFGIETHLKNFEKGKVKIVLAEGLASEPKQGTSQQVIHFPDTVKLDIFSRQNLAGNDDTIRMQVFYFDGTVERVLYDGFIQFSRLEKKVLEIDLARLNGEGGRALGFKLNQEQLAVGEIIKLN
jgi:hypothetical protein